MPSLASTCSREAVTFYRECGPVVLRESMLPSLWKPPRHRITATEHENKGIRPTAALPIPLIAASIYNE